MSQNPIHVLITGAAGQIGYSLIPLVCSGRVTGDKKIVLHLLDIEKAMKGLQGVVMEIEDCAYPLISKVIATSDLKEAFTDVEIAIFVGGFPRLPGMERKDLIQKNSSIFVQQGAALSQYANANCKVLVIANPANSNCLVALKNAASKLPAENFSCLTRLDQNRAQAQVAKRFDVPTEAVQNVIVWGNHSSTMYADYTHAKVNGTPVSEVKDAAEKLTEDWNKTFLKTVQQRGAAIIEARGFSSALSAAKAAVDHLHDWLVGTPAGVYASMGVISDGSYGVEKDIVFSFPCTCVNGKYTIVQGLAFTDFGKQMMKTTEKELLEEKAQLNLK